jgi:signal peptidase I
MSAFQRMYSLMLYAYPRDFRREYGEQMQQIFRDRCRELAGGEGWRPVARFAAHLTVDLVSSSARERASAVWSAARKPGRRGFISEWSMTIIMYLFAATTLVQAYVVPTGSMENTIRIGDHMLVDRVGYADPGPMGRHILPYREIGRGDLVVFHYPEDVRTAYVKRVIGIPGDRIRLENKQVVRNGRRLVEPYTQHISPYTEPYRDNFPQPADFYTTPRGRDMLANHVEGGEIVVPPDALFVLGDNRDNSADSRYWGFVPRRYVIGKPLLVYWSYDAPTADLQEWNFRHLVDLAEHFFTRTRWDRILLVPRSQAAREIGDRQ